MISFPLFLLCFAGGFGVLMLTIVTLVEVFSEGRLFDWQVRPAARLVRRFKPETAATLLEASLLDPATRNLWQATNSLWVECAALNATIRWNGEVLIDGKRVPLAWWERPLVLQTFKQFCKGNDHTAKRLARHTGAELVASRLRQQLEKAA